MSERGATTGSGHRLARAIQRSVFSSAGFAPLLFIILLAINIWLNPARFAPAAWGTLLGLAAPLIGAAVASTPAFLGGRGGIDISVGPLMGFVNAIIVLVFIPLFALPGREGKLFVPLAMGYVVSLVASLGVSLTVTPVLENVVTDVALTKLVLVMPIEVAYLLINCAKTSSLPAINSANATLASLPD